MESSPGKRLGDPWLIVTKIQERKGMRFQGLAHPWVVSSCGSSLGTILCLGFNPWFPFLSRPLLSGIIGNDPLVSKEILQGIAPEKEEGKYNFIKTIRDDRQDTNRLSPLPKAFSFKSCLLSLDLAGLWAISSSLSFSQ
jgi:hypothetical protein